MSRFRGFTVSFNAIGSGKVLRRYLVLACKDMLLPLLSRTNVNMIEAKCRCQVTLNTRAVFRKTMSDTWVKYQLLQVVAPSQAKHLQAKRLLEALLPGSTVLQEYKDTAQARIRCKEFVPDNKSLVFGYHRNGLTRPTFGEIEDLEVPGWRGGGGDGGGGGSARPWQLTQRERRGVSSPVHVCPLQRSLNILGLLDMLLMQQQQQQQQQQQAPPKGKDSNRSCADTRGGRSSGGGGSSSSRSSDNAVEGITRNWSSIAESSDELLQDSEPAVQQLRRFRMHGRRAGPL